MVWRGSYSASKFLTTLLAVLCPGLGNFELDTILLYVFEFHIRYAMQLESHEPEITRLYSANLTIRHI